MDFRAIRYRLRNDFQLAVLTMFAAISLLGILPFAVMRALNAEWSALALDSVIVSGISVTVAYTWRTGETKHSSLFLAYFLGIVATVAVRLLPPVGQFWLYPAIVANFFLVDRRHALLIALLALFGALIGNEHFGGSLSMLSYSTTNMVCALLSYAFSYRTAVQREQLETLVVKDALTGVFNRRALTVELVRAHNNYEREHLRCGILVFDLDHFKKINDRHGHMAGDQVLSLVARILEQHVRKGDRVFRYGGEEFVILTTPTDEAALEQMAEKLRVIIERSVDNCYGYTVTTSVGGAALRIDESVDDWFTRADDALYAAKNAGRNRAFIAPSI